MPTETLRLEELPRRLGKMAARIEALTFGPALKTSAVLISASNKQNFVNASSPDGIPWAPLKSRVGRPLRDTGLLMASVGGGAGHVEQVSGLTLVMGTSIHYGQYHQRGTSRMPARTFLGFNEPLIEKINRVFSEYVGKEMSRV